MKVRGRCGHIVTGVEIFDNFSDDGEHHTNLLCPVCEEEE